MKRTILSLALLTLMIFSVPMPSAANEKTGKETSDAISAEAVSEAKADINRMVDRIIEIKGMDLNSLNKDERKELRKEVKTIKHDLKEYSKSESEAISEAAATGARGSGIYISGGALLVVIILLIVLL